MLMLCKGTEIGCWYVILKWWNLTKMVRDIVKILTHVILHHTIKYYISGQLKLIFKYDMNKIIILKNIKFKEE